MKNKLFSALSADKKQKRLRAVLRDKSDDNLIPEEEDDLITELTAVGQVRIRVFFDTDTYFRLMRKIGVREEHVILGGSEFERVRTSEKMPKAAIAVLPERVQDPYGINQVFILVPPNRSRQNECFNYEALYLHVEVEENDSMRCSRYDRFRETGR